MNDDDCKQYVADPEAHSGHLDSCERCSALFGDDLSLLGEKLPPLTLPLASWEGASHRSWVLVVTAAVAVFAIASAFFAVAGVSPLSGMTAALRAAFPSLEMVQMLVFRVSSAFRNVPALWQAGVLLAFVAVNALLVALLRRAPKGLDV